MQLRSQAYAFFDPATLFIYRDPFSPYLKVRDFIFFPPERAPSGSASYWESAQALLDTLNIDERKDFVLRLSSYAHERQHFHDMLLTHYGNSLVRSFFVLGVRLMALLRDLVQKHQNTNAVIALPLQESDVLDPTNLGLAYSAFNNYQERLEGARYTFEASAIVTQTLAARDWFGSLGEEVLRHNFRGSLLYEAVPAALDGQLTRILDSGEEVGIRQLRQLILAALSSDEPDHILLHLIDSLRALADRLEAGDSLPKPFASDLNAMVDSLQSHASALREANSDFLLDSFQTLLEQNDLPQVVSDCFVGAFSSFIDASADTQRQFQEDPGPFLDGWGLLNPPSNFVEPHEYIYVSLAHEHSALMHGEITLDEDDIYTIREVHLPGGPVRILRLHPSPWEAHGRCLPRAPWIEIAKGPAGAISLLATPNFLDPR